jgi:hypothetical protein
LWWESGNAIVAAVLEMALLSSLPITYTTSSCKCSESFWPNSANRSGLSTRYILRT